MIPYGMGSLNDRCHLALKAVCKMGGILEIDRVLADDFTKRFLPDLEQRGVCIGEAAVEAERTHKIGNVREQRIEGLPLAAQFDFSARTFERFPAAVGDDMDQLDFVRTPLAGRRRMDGHTSGK